MRIPNRKYFAGSCSDGSEAALELVTYTHTHTHACLCLIYSLQDLPPEEVPYLAIPLHTVIKVTPKAYGCAEKRYKMMV